MIYLPPGYLPTTLTSYVSLYLSSQVPVPRTWCQYRFVYDPHHGAASAPFFFFRSFFVSLPLRTRWGISRPRSELRSIVFIIFIIVWARPWGKDPYLQTIPHMAYFS